MPIARSSGIRITDNPLSRSSPRNNNFMSMVDNAKALQRSPLRRIIRLKIQLSRSTINPKKKKKQKNHWKNSHLYTIPSHQSFKNPWALTRSNFVNMSLAKKQSRKEYKAVSSSWLQKPQMGELTMFLLHLNRFTRRLLWTSIMCIFSGAFSFQTLGQIELTSNVFDMFSSQRNVNLEV